MIKKTEFWRMLWRGEDEGEESLRMAIKGFMTPKTQLTPEWLLRQMPLALLALAYFMTMTTLHYERQQDLLMKAELQKEVEDMTYRSITVSSELAQAMRESMIARQLRAAGDSTLLPSLEAPYVIECEP